MWIALFLTGIAVFGSLVPLKFQPMDLDEGLRRFREIPYLDLSIEHRADWVANILLFLPVAFCWLGVVMLDRPRLSPWLVFAPLVVLACAVLSVVLEFTQQWFPPRTVSQNDIQAETIGSLLGVGLWLAVGQVTVDWIRSYVKAQRPRDQVDWLLGAYFIGLLVYSVLPLNLTINPADMYHKYRDGRIVLTPFADVPGGLFGVYGLMRDVVLFLPVGMLVATWRTSPERPVRPFGFSVLLGGLLVLGIELAQLLVFTRYSATGDVITGTIGVAAGVWIMRRWRAPGAVDAPLDPSLRRALVWLALATVYVGLLFVVFGAPFNPIDDVPTLRERANHFLTVPFASLYRNTEFNAVSEILKKMLFFAPLGSMLAMVVVPLRVPRAVGRILLVIAWMLAAGIATAIEIAQVFLPPHVPDVTDVLLCSAGAAFGILLTARLISVRRSTP